jgi:hypothetical protein
METYTKTTLGAIKRMPLQEHIAMTQAILKTLQKSSILRALILNSLLVIPEVKIC